jgi:hypothetical protein
MLKDMPMVVVAPQQRAWASASDVKDYNVDDALYVGNMLLEK